MENLKEKNLKKGNMKKKVGDQPPKTYKDKGVRVYVRGNGVEIDIFSGFSIFLETFHRRK